MHLETGGMIDPITTAVLGTRGLGTVVARCDDAEARSAFHRHVRHTFVDHATARG